MEVAKNTSAPAERNPQIVSLFEMISKLELLSPVGNLLESVWKISCALDYTDKDAGSPCYWTSDWCYRDSGFCKQTINCKILVLIHCTGF